MEEATAAKELAKKSRTEGDQQRDEQEREEQHQEHDSPMPNLEVPLPMPNPQAETTRVAVDPSVVEKQLEKEGIEKEVAAKTQRK